MREIRADVFQGRFHNLLISKNNTFWVPQISRITFQVVTMTLLHHAFSAWMARFLHRTSLSRGPEGEPTGTDECWCGQQNARDCGTAVEREGAASPQVWPVRSRGALVAPAWLFSLLRFCKVYCSM